MQSALSRAYERLGKNRFDFIAFTRISNKEYVNVELECFRKIRELRGLVIANGEEKMSCPRRLECPNDICVQGSAG